MTQAKKYTDPSDLSAQIYQLTNTIAANQNVQVSAAGINPGATAADNVLFAFTVPANYFDQANRELLIKAAGSFGATANIKEIKIYAGCTTAVVGSTVTGGTVISDTGAVTTNGGRWQVEADIIKYGAAGSNTQLAVDVTGVKTPQALTLTESGSILIAITGNATTATTDIVANWFEAFGKQ